MATRPVARQVQVGKLRGQVIQKNGNKSPIITLQHVTHLSKGCHNLWNISKMLLNGWSMKGDYNKIVLTRDGISIVFDIVAPTTTGCLYCLRFTCDTQEDLHIGIKRLAPLATLEVLHARLGHMNTAAVKHVAATLGLEVTSNTMSICEACAKAKAQLKTFHKIEDTVPQQNLELRERRLYMDIEQLK